MNYHERSAFSWPNILNKLGSHQLLKVIQDWRPQTNKLMNPNRLMTILDTDLKTSECIRLIF